MDLKTVIRLLKTSPWLAPVLAGIDALLWLTDRLAMLLAKRTAGQSRSLVVLRFDVLGDYLAFRGYLRYLKTQSAYRTHRLTLVGNQTFRGLAHQLDADIVDEFIWVDIYKLSTNLAYRFNVVQQLRQLGAETVFCPTYSRVLVLDDFLARATNAPERIGCIGDGINLTRWEVGWGNRQYTRLLPTQAGYVFELIRNQQIISAFLQIDVPILPPHIDPRRLPAVATPVPSVVLSLGAGQAFRVWPANRFAAVVQHLHTHYPGHTILLTGAPGEDVYADALLEQLPQPDWVQNLTAKLSLLELLAILRRADLLISNETGTVHLAAALHTPTIVISQGKSLVRWHPYPATLKAPIRHIYPPYIEQHRADLTAIAAQFNPESPFAITDVSAERVIEQLDLLLAQKAG
ncbi:glycosyltransferase family 9 protein [Fibrella arboris]|uniref:glycosyltransferase family 9 protein n=1 Tax=Fibrella arboris TaxID=3242486 RepID=UPI00352074B7